MRGNSHVRFLGGFPAVRRGGYPTWPSMLAADDSDKALKAAHDDAFTLQMPRACRIDTRPVRMPPIPSAMAAHGVVIAIPCQRHANAMPDALHGT